jgi:CHAT domain-containing protein
MREEEARRPLREKAVAVFADPVFDPSDERVRDKGRAPGPSAPANDGARGAPLPRAVAETDLAGSGLNLPRLVFSREEAEAVCRAAPAGKCFKALDFDASRTAVLEGDLGGCRVVHFATHGLLDTEHPALSGLVMSTVDPAGRPRDGFLRLQDIYNLRLPAGLVTLSACQTALGREIRWEGLVGLTRGFMYAGAQRVIASLWKVDDEATACLMKEFYRRLFGPGAMRPSRALQEAQQAVRKQKRWQAPYYWAAFILQGEWK